MTAFVQNAGHNSAHLTGTTITAAVSGITVGNTLIVLAAANADAGATLTSITDDQGAANTYTADVQALSSTLPVVIIGSGKVVSAPSTVTATFGANTYNRYIIVIEARLADSPFDKGATAGYTALTTAFATAATATTTADNEFVIAAFKVLAKGDAPSWTKGASYTDLGALATTTYSTFCPEYKDVTSKAAMTADGAWAGSSDHYLGAVATYKSLTAPTTSIKAVAGVADASISKVEGVALASIGKVSGLA